MLAEAYIIVWNEIDTIDFTIDHYEKICDKINIFDNWSDDGTFERAIHRGCNVERFGIRGVLDDTEYLKIKNNAWKGSKADWVFVVDSDEIVYCSRSELDAACQAGANMFNTIGWNIFSESMPKNSFDEITTGVADVNYAKKCLFSPAIQDINYVYGCHVAKPVGHIRIAVPSVVLAHYRNIGGVERLKDRHKLYQKRLSPKNRKFGLGCHYLYPDERREAEFYENLKKSIPMDLISGAGVDQSVISSQLERSLSTS